ncbi:MAG: flagellar basal-body rod protein FlgG [Halobacteriovoraceae bacterium]|nr:flagellar basal-body rod protein FlgG [Halobacteriovoraceae bacterium]
MKLPSFKVFVIFLYCFNAHGAFRALHTAATGMAVQERTVTNISHNISNLGTTAFKRSRTESGDLLYVTMQEPGSRSSPNTLYNVGIQFGSGAKVVATRKEFAQGIPNVTKRPFDLMIEGDGFFGIILPNDEIRYTRNGSFNLDEQGRLVNYKGYQVYPGFTFPPNTLNVDIHDNGLIDIYVAGSDEPINLGQIPVFTFTNQVGLKAMSGSLFSPTTASGDPLENIPGLNGAGAVEQGSLETSNVSIMNEMTSLIAAQRAYEMNSKVMKVVDDMMGIVNNIR